VWKRTEGGGKEGNSLKITVLSFKEGRREKRKVLLCVHFFKKGKERRKK